MNLRKTQMQWRQCISLSIWFQCFIAGKCVRERKSAVKQDMRKSAGKREQKP